MSAPALAPQRVQHLDVDVLGSCLSATLWVPERPRAAVVLSHGLYLDSSCWATVARLLTSLEPDVAVLAYDHRGHGRSPVGGPMGTAGSRPALGIELLADDLADMVATVRTSVTPGLPVVLAAHSLGTMAALSALGRTGRTGGRGRPDAMVLLGSSAGCLSGGGLLKRLPTIANRHPGAFAMAQKMLRNAAAPVLGRPCPHSGPAVDPVDAAALLASIGAYDLIPRIAGLLEGMPLALLTGACDRITPASHAEAIRAAASCATLSVIPGVGHDLPSAVPTRIVSALRKSIAAL